MGEKREQAICSPGLSCCSPSLEKLQVGHTGVAGSWRGARAGEQRQHTLQGTGPGGQAGWLPGCYCLVAKLCLTLPLSMGFPRQESWCGLPFPPPGGLPNPGIKPASRAWLPGLTHKVSLTGGIHAVEGDGPKVQF